MLGMGIGEGLFFPFSLHFRLFSRFFPVVPFLDLGQFLGKNFKNLSKNLFVSYIYSTFVHLLVIICSSFKKNYSIWALTALFVPKGTN